MEQEFLKVKDYQTLQLTSFQAVGDGKRIAFERAAFEQENDDS